MPGLNVLVLGDSPRATELIAGIDADDRANRHTATSSDVPDLPDLPDLVILAGSNESDLAIALHLLESGRPLILIAGPHLTSAIVHRLGLISEGSKKWLGSQAQEAALVAGPGQQCGLANPKRFES